MPTADIDLLKASLQDKLKTIAAGSDKRQDIIIQQSPDDLDQTHRVHHGLDAHDLRRGTQSIFTVL